MTTFTNRIYVEQPPDVVFAFLADFANVPLWNYAIESTTKVSPGPVGVGTVYRQTRTIPRRSTESFDVTTFEPAIRLGLRGQLGPFRSRIGYELRATPRGTELVNELELESSGPSGMLAGLAARPVKAAVAANLATLKDLLETRR